MAQLLKADRNVRSVVKSNSYSVTRHNVHPRLQRIELAPHVIATFLDKVGSIDVQNLEYVPYLRFCLADTLVKCAGPSFHDVIIKTIFDRLTGGFTIGLCGITDDASDYVKFGTAIGHLLGSANHDAMSNAYYARFVVKHTDDSDSYLRQAYRLFTLHTDGTFVDEQTDWLLMMKFSELNAKGGESRLLHLDDWEERDAYASSELANIDFEYKAPGSKNVNDTVQRPLLFENKFGLCASFIDQFVQPKTIREATFLNAFSQSLEESEGTKEVPLPPGELIVLNNHFWLHGRAPFEQNKSLHRELMRQRGVFSGAIEHRIAC